MPGKRRAVVIFSDNGSHILAPFLKQGFRHCYCLVDDGRYWLLVDAKEGIPEVRAVAASDFDIVSWVRERGDRAVMTQIGERPPRAPFAVANCVGLTKAMLSIRSCAVTPFQLYRHLIKQRRKKP